MEKLSSRAVIGQFYLALTAMSGAPWIGPVSNYFPSDQGIEEYAWLGMTPAMREWVGGRQAKGLPENSMAIRNKHFEATLEVLVKDMRRDKSGQVFARIRDLARRANSHWASLLTTLVMNGESTVCYDGQYFFDTDHSEGQSGTQSNDITVDISALPAAVHGTTTAPSVEEMQLAIATAIQQMAGFKDDQGEPMNEDMSSFLVKVPVPLMNVALQAVRTPAQVDASQTALEALKGVFSIAVVPNPRLTWTDKFAVFRTDANLKPFIRQEETAVMLKAKAEGSEFEFDNDAHQYGIDTWRNVGYGYWQYACLAQLI